MASTGLMHSVRALFRYAESYMPESDARGMGRVCHGDIMAYVKIVFLSCSEIPIPMINILFPERKY